MTEIVVFRIDRETLRRFDAVAAASERSRAQQLRLLVKKAASGQRRQIRRGAAQAETREASS